ncbi:glutathione S-transferase U19 [Citrus sinensis]|nr:glutathione S-transferase U19 [Citrus sinensis]
MSKGDVVLLDCWASPFCLRAKVALAEKGVEYEARAENLFWADFIDKKVFDAVCNTWKSKGEVPETAKNEFIEILKQLEGALGEKDFFGEDSFGFVDVIAIPLTCWFYAVEKFGGFNVENECPKFSAWMNKCMQRETVARILPDPEKVTNLLSR